MKTTKYFLFFLLSLTAIVMPKNSYTGYSGAPGSKGTCASSCHGSGTGSLTVTGFPTVYVPNQTYTLTVQYSSGSTISNFNASTRLGITTTGAGTFVAGTGTALYTVSGAESGVRASSNGRTSASFSWKAPAAGSGTVTFYLSGLQGSMSGTNTKVVLTATEQTSSAANEAAGLLTAFALKQNYPNPFNPQTVIRYQLPEAEMATLTIFDILGNEIATLVNEIKSPGSYEAVFDGSKLNSGIYFYQLKAGKAIETRKMQIMK